MSTRDRLVDEASRPLALRKAEARGYLVVTPRTPSDAADAWHDRCEARGHPVVTIERLPRGRAEITLDTTTWPHPVTRIQEEAIVATFKAAGARFGRGHRYWRATVRGKANLTDRLARALLQIVAAAPDEATR